VPDDTWTILRVLTWTAERFARQGIGSARLDAEVLLAHLLGVDRIRLYTDFDKPLAAPELARVRDGVRRRLAGEPVAYITGEREFWSLTLSVDRAVLVPRPETELLVEVALELCRGLERPTFVDVGTGSGAIAIALGHTLPAARLVAIDREAAAIEVAARNAARHAVTLTLLAGDLLDPLPPGEQPDLLLSNLPYVPSAELAGLAPEVRDWEPRTALDGGADGLALIRRLVPQASRRLPAGAALALEVGAGQAGAVRTLFEEHGFLAVEVRRDLAQLERVVVGRRAE
jgi:release factor glutamine methyltransferase